MERELKHLMTINAGDGKWNVNLLAVITDGEVETRDSINRSGLSFEEAEALRESFVNNTHNG
jgi:hypothetical protein